MSARMDRLGALRRVASALARPARGRVDPWSDYLNQVEPAIAAHPRVHRFAQVPRIGEPELTGEPLAVWIEDDGEDSALRTSASIATGSLQPSAVLHGSLRDALQNTRCPRVALVRGGDTLAPLALERLSQAAQLAPDAAVITCDEDVLDASGSRHSPRFRPGPSPDRWLSCDDSGALLVIAREEALTLLQELNLGVSGWRHALALALARPDGSGHAHVPLLLCHTAPAAPGTVGAATSGVTDFLKRWEPDATVRQTGETRRVRRPLKREPLVEVVVCFRDKPELLKRCVTSLLTHTTYDHLRVTLVDNGSVEAETWALLGEFERDRRIRVLQDARPFNFAALNNFGARSSEADALVFLNNDVEVTDPDWLEHLLEEALRPEVGAVAPLLLYPDGRVQHVGAAIGLHGYAGHPFAHLSPDADTPFGRADGGTRNWLAVTAACMVVERWKFDAVGGFDESFVVAGNDVDLCLRLTAAGHRSLCVPHARLLHDESRSRGSHIDPQDFVRSEQRYGEFRTVGDPFYNPNLTLSRTDCSVRLPGEGTS